MSTPARLDQPDRNQNFDSILKQLPTRDQQSLDNARQQLAEAPVQDGQGKSVSHDELAQLPVGSTPQISGKNLVHKYGRGEASHEAVREQTQEPDR